MAKGLESSWIPILFSVCGVRKVLTKMCIRDRANPNGYFDFVDGYTIDASTGRVFFPSAEPFGQFLRGKIGSGAAVSYTHLYYNIYNVWLRKNRTCGQRKLGYCNCQDNNGKLRCA